MPRPRLTSTLVEAARRDASQRTAIHFFLALIFTLLTPPLTPQATATPPPNDAPAPLLDTPPDHPPWHPATWLPATPTLTAIHWTDHPTPTLHLDFGPADADIILRPQTPTTIHLWLPTTTLTPLTLPPPRPPLTALALDATPGGPTLTLTLTHATPITLEKTPTGYHLHLTPPTYTPHDPLAPQDPDRWTTQATPAETALHQATTLARAGHAPQAIAHLQTAARHPAPLPIRAALDLLEAHITHREGLTLIALAAATRAHRRARDPQTRNDALALALQINTHLPGSLALIAPDLADTLIDLAKTPPLDATTAHHAFETGRALLHLDDPDTAATLLRLAHHHRPLRDRARYLAYAAARLATDPEAATAHLDHLATRTLDPHLRAHTHAARARHHYEQARPTQAATAYALAATTADPDSPLAEAIRIEQGWLALRQAQAQTQAQGQPQPQPQATLNALLPLDLNHHAPPRALLIGTLYHHLCHPARAATIATALIDRLDRDLDPIGRQFATERVTLSRPRWQPVRDPLLARLAEHRDRYEALQTLNPDAFYHREALRLRISADARASDEAREAMRKDKPPPPPEPPMPTWTDAIWQEAAPITDRCPSLGVPSPLADSPSRDAK